MYEIIFKYHELGEDGTFNKEETKEKKVKIGALDDEVPLEQVAGKIIAQLARKKIDVVEVKIFEYTKKELNFKEIDDGFKIGKRKFSFEDGALITADKEEELDTSEQLLALIKNNPQLLAQLNQQPGKMSIAVPNQAQIQTFGQQTQPSKPVLLSNQNNVPQRYEVFDPVAAPDYPACMEMMKKKGWKFTTGKSYPIFQEKPASNMPLDGMLYSTVDDAGVRCNIKGFYFVPQTRGLTGSFVEDNQRYVGDSGREPNLMFQSGVSSEMPDIRRGGGGGIAVSADMPTLRNGGGAAASLEMPDIRRGRA